MPHPLEARPSFALLLQLTTAGWRQPVELRALLVFGEAPLGIDPSAAFEPMQGRVKRSVIDLQHVVRTGRNRDADAMTMQGTGLKGAKNQEVERASQQVVAVLIGRLWQCRRESTTRVVGSLLLEARG